MQVVHVYLHCSYMLTCIILYTNMLIGVSMIFNGLSKLGIYWPNNELPVDLRENLIGLCTERMFKPSELGSIFNALAVMKVSLVY